MGRNIKLSYPVSGSYVADSPGAILQDQIARHGAGQMEWILFNLKSSVICPCPLGLKPLTPPSLIGALARREPRLPINSTRIFLWDNALDPRHDPQNRLTEGGQIIRLAARDEMTIDNGRGILPDGTRVDQIVLNTR